MPTKKKTRDLTDREAWLCVLVVEHTRREEMFYADESGEYRTQFLDYVIGDLVPTDRQIWNTLRERGLINLAEMPRGRGALVKGGRLKEARAAGYVATPEGIAYCDEVLRPRLMRMNAVLVPSADDIAMWFGLSYASWLTLPRVLMEAMPPEWIQKMAVLLNEYNEAYPNMPDIGTRVLLTKDGKLIKTIPALIQYRHPDHAYVNSLRGPRR